MASDDLRDFPDLPDEAWESIHARVKAFEAAWAGGPESGVPPRLGDFLPNAPGGPGGDPDAGPPADFPASATGQLLVELAHADLEFRLRTGRPARVEEYLAAFPALEATPAAVAGLAAAEYRLRRRIDPDAAPAEYRSRFPGLGPLLDVLLAAAPDEGVTCDETLAEGRAGDEDPGLAEPLPTVPGYEVLGRLGRGGMGVVYKAVETRLGRPVALKTVRPGADARARERLRREAAAAAALAHPHVVPVYAVFEEGDRLYVATEYLPGGTLAQKAGGHPLVARQAAALLEPVARAVAYAHGHGVVHRDLKPSNVLLAEDGTPKVGDFGLAKRAGDDSGLTRAGVISGSPAYMAPEQAGGTFRVGPATDVWALGAVLYELLTGRPPFRGATVLDTLELVRSAEPVPPRRLVPKLPRDLETVCLKCLEKDPAKRYGTADALADDLARFRRGEPVRARPIGRVSRAARWARRNPAAAALTGTIAATAMAAAAGLAGYTSALDRLNAELNDRVGERDQAFERQEAALRSAGEARARADAAKAEAEANARTARRLVFASDLRHAGEAAREGDLVRAAGLLALHREEPPGDFAFAVNFLNRLARAPGGVFDGLGDDAYFVCFSPDAGTAAACGKPGEVRLYEAGTWKPLARWDAGQGELNGLAFSPDGARLATAGDDGAVALWEVASGRPVWRTKVYERQAYQVAFGLGGSVLAVCGHDPQMVVLDAAGGGVAARLAADPDHVEALAATPDGATAVTAGWTGRVVAWDLAAREERWSYDRSGDRDDLMSVAVSSDGRFAAFGRRDPAVLVLRVADGRPVHDGPLPGAGTAGTSDGFWLRTVGFLPDGRTLAAASDAGAVHLSGVTARGLQRSDVRRSGWLAHGDRVSCLAAGKRTVLTASRDGSVAAWRPGDADPWLVRRMPDGDGLAWVAAAGERRGAWLAWARPDGLAFVNTRTEAVRPADGGAGAWRGLAASVDGRRVFAGGGAGEFVCWDTEARAPAVRFRTRFAVNDGVAVKDGVDVAGATADGRRALVSFDLFETAGTDETELRVCDGDAGETLAARRFAAATDNAVLSPGGTLAAANQGPVVLLLDPATLETRRELSGHGDKVVRIAVAPDGGRVATAGNDREIIVWDAASGDVVLRWQAGPGGIESLGFSPDGRLLLSATASQPPRLWDVETGRLVLEPGSAASFEDWAPAAFTPDGTRILVGDEGAVLVLDGRPFPEGDSVR